MYVRSIHSLSAWMTDWLSSCGSFVILRIFFLQNFWQREWKKFLLIQISKWKQKRESSQLPSPDPTHAYNFHVYAYVFWARWRRPRMLDGVHVFSHNKICVMPPRTRFEALPSSSSSSSSFLASFSIRRRRSLSEDYQVGLVAAAVFQRVPRRRWVIVLIGKD